MSNLIYIILCLLTFININIKGLDSFFNDYLDLDNIKSVKGIFVWMIFFRHYTGYYRRNKKEIFIIIDKSFSQNIVSLFLFYSGYGINESFKIKGNKYIKTLPIKSGILFIKSQIILLIYLCNNLFLGIKTSLKTYLKAIIFKKGIGNSYWFAFTIISLYIYSFISFILIKNQKYNLFGIFLISIICYLHGIFVYNFYHKKQIISVDTIICFVFGFYYSFFRTHLEKIIMKNDITYLGALLIFILIYYYYYIYQNKNIYYISLKNGLFTLISILITMKIKFKNEFLNLLNSHSYSIYLLQRVVMIYIRKKILFNDHEFIRFVVEFLLVIFISIIFDKNSIFIDKIFKLEKFKKNYIKENKSISDDKIMFVNKNIIS